MGIVWLVTLSAMLSFVNQMNWFVYKDIWGHVGQHEELLWYLKGALYKCSVTLHYIICIRTYMLAGLCTHAYIHACVQIYADKQMDTNRLSVHCVVVLCSCLPIVSLSLLSLFICRWCCAFVFCSILITHLHFASEAEGANDAAVATVESYGHIFSFTS